MAKHLAPHASFCSCSECTARRLAGETTAPTTVNPSPEPEPEHPPEPDGIGIGETSDEGSTGETSGFAPGTVPM